MEDENLDRVYCAATFLRPTAKRDDAPDSTLACLAVIVGRIKKAAGPGGYEIDGKPVPVSFRNWVELVADYGPRARPHTATLIRIQREQGMNDWSGYAELRKVGGREILTFLFEVLPKVSAEADRITNAPPNGPKRFAGDDPRLGWLQSQREVRFGIDRWAGRLFDSDADRRAWWEANQGRSPEEWLAANLDVVAGQVDKRVTWAVGIGYEVLPDLPGEPPGGRPGLDGFARITIPGAGGEPFAVKWLGEHRTKLRYDKYTGAFRLMR